MRVITGPRKAGKTHQLVDWCAEAPGRRTVVLATSKLAREAERMAGDMYPEAGWMRDVNFVTPERLQYLRGYGQREVAVDDIEMVLSDLLSHHVVLGTMTVEAGPTPEQVAETISLF